MIYVRLVQRCVGEVFAGEGDVKKDERWFLRERWCLRAAWVVAGVSAEVRR